VLDDAGRLSDNRSGKRDSLKKETSQRMKVSLKGGGGGERCRSAQRHEWNLKGERGELPWKSMKRRDRCLLTGININTIGGEGRRIILSEKFLPAREEVEKAQKGKGQKSLFE